MIWLIFFQKWVIFFISGFSGMRRGGLGSSFWTWWAWCTAQSKRIKCREKEYKILKLKCTKIVVQEPTVRAKIAGSCSNLPTSGDPKTPSEVQMGPKHDDLRWMRQQMRQCNTVCLSLVFYWCLKVDGHVHLSQWEWEIWQMNDERNYELFAQACVDNAQNCGEIRSKDSVRRVL